MLTIKQLPVDWANILREEFEQDYFKSLQNTLQAEHQARAIIYPQEKNIFQAFHQTTLANVRVVILGQDPYHGEGQAMGLSFSVPEGVKVPPSLKNIFKEIARDIGTTPPAHGDLTRWAKQGVFLLNTALTVRAKEAGSHSRIGWHKFTDAVIQEISAQRENVVFLLWGNHAISKRNLIDEDQHLVLISVHPSPLSAHRGFVGCDHFSKANTYLKDKDQTPIDW